VSTAVLITIGECVC